ncbi:MAG: DUF6442 family protein [Lachnospiraceae bacterium]|nr:DUF6442 family protein [Lachnospiraceae bacterium]
MNNPMESNEAKKAAILERSRNAKKDEGMENADYRGSKIGVIIYAVVAFILIIFCIPAKMDIVNAIASLSFAWVVGGTFSYYRFTKRKIHLVCVIASGIAVIAFALMAILQ